jgi:hypothetical protein
MSNHPNRHYVSMIEDVELLENHFRVDYPLDRSSMRWVYDWGTPEELRAAQDFLFEHSPHSGGVL